VRPRYTSLEPRSHHHRRLTSSLAPKAFWASSIPLSALFTPDNNIMAHHSNGLFGVIEAKRRPATVRGALAGSGRRRLRTAGATLDPYEMLGGLTVVTGLVANGNFVLPAVTGAAGLVALGGMRDGDRLDYVLQNNSVNAAGTATLVVDVAATFTLRGPLVVPINNTLHVHIIMNSATTALCFTELVAPTGTFALGTQTLVSYVDVYQNLASGNTASQGVYNAAGGLATLTAAQLLGGYVYVGAAGGNVALTLPGAAAVQAALLAKGITSAAGLRLQPILVMDTDAGANTITVTAGAGETVHGTAVINNDSAAIHYVFTAAATAVALVVQGN